MLKRRHDWEERLTAVLSRSFDRPFQYGQFDCALFVTECIEALTGEDLSFGLRGTYSDKVGAALAMRRAFGGGVSEIASGVAIRNDIQEIPPSFASIGDIVLIGNTLGVCVGEIALAPVEPRGLEHFPITAATKAWQIGKESSVETLKPCF